MDEGQKGGAGGRVEEILESVFFNTVHIGVVVNAKILEDFAGYPRQWKSILRVRGFLNYGG